MNIIISYPNAGKTWITSILDTLNIDVKFSHYGVFIPMNTLKDYTEKYPNKFIDSNICILHRDMKDWIVSSYFQMKDRLHYFNGTLSDFIRSEQYGVERIINYNLFWKKYNSCKKIFFISYEQMSSNSCQTIDTILTNFNINIDVNDIIKAIQYNSFDQMRKREITKCDSRNWYKRTNLSNINSLKTRVGKVGNYINYLTDDDIKYIDYMIAKYDYLNVMNS